jgi:hypothetical protein
MNWCICRAPSESFFITSDCPCVPFVLNADGSAIIVAGFGQDNVEITFPLTPSICLYLSKKPMKRYRAIHKNLVKEFNKRTAHGAGQHRDCTKPYRADGGSLGTFTQEANIVEILPDKLGSSTIKFKRT